MMLPPRQAELDSAYYHPVKPNSIQHLKVSLSYLVMLNSIQHLRF